MIDIMVKSIHIDILSDVPGGTVMETPSNQVL